MYLRIKKLISHSLNTQTAKELLLVYGSNAAKLGLGFLINILLAKSLGAYNYGVFALVINFFLTISGLSDLGLSHSTIKLYSERKLIDEKKADKFLRGMFFFRITISFVFMLLALIWASYFGKKYFGDNIEIRILIISSILILFDSIFNYLLAQLQAVRKIKKYSLTNFSFNVVRLLVILLLVYFNILDVETTIISFLIATIIGLCIVLYKESFFRTDGVYNEFKDSIKDVLFWGKWLMLTTLANALFIKIDVILLGYFKIEKELIGNYGLALTFAFVLGFFQQTTQIFVLPKVSKIKLIEELKTYIKNSIKLDIVLIFGIILTLILGYFAIQLLFSKQFVFSADLFLILALSYAFSLITIPFILLVFAIEKPQLTTFNNVLGLILILIFSFILIPKYNIYGCAYSVLLSRIVTDITTIIIVTYFIKKKFSSKRVDVAI